MKTIRLIAALAAALSVGALAYSASMAVAQQPAAKVDPALLAQGQQLYEANCAACHQAGGTGSPPTSPALNGNQHLLDVYLIVSNVHAGRNAMRAFSNLTAPQIAALATYVRNAWTNQFGGATTDEVAALVKLADIKPTVSVWTGVYTTAQDERGTAVHSAVCSKCHGRNLNGVDDPAYPQSPAIARASFLHRWQGRSLALLYTYVRATMPFGSPGSLTDQQYIDAIAHILAVSNMPAGGKELPTDPAALASLLIEEQK